MMNARVLDATHMCSCYRNPTGRRSLRFALRRAIHYSFCAETCPFLRFLQVTKSLNNHNNKTANVYIIKKTILAFLFRSSPMEPTMPPAPTGIHPVDLLLPKEKTPTDIKKFSSEFRPGTVQEHIPLYAIGSSRPGEKICHKRDVGLFQCVYEAWKNHYNLRTSPEDWWFPVACKIAKGIDEVAKKEGLTGQKVRDLFVDHQGKENICVDVDVFTIYQVDYVDFFSKMSSEITSRIKVPEYANVMQNDFTTSTTTYRIASQINLMASMQQFFSYGMGLCGCGIKGVEMLGEQSDWDQLSKKLKLLRDQLEPIHDYLPYELKYGNWWEHVDLVFKKLAETYAVKDDKQKEKEVADFWADIFMIGDGWKYGPSGFGGHAAKEYNGWLVKFLTGRDKILEEDFFKATNVEKLKGLNSVPMKITFKYLNPPVSDMATLTAGILGFQLHDGKETFNGVPSLQPHHMWALGLPPNSPLRHHG